MIVIALLILPVLIVEYSMGEHRGLPLAAPASALQHGSHLVRVCDGVHRDGKRVPQQAPLLWQHWLDLAIIILPAISFLRSLRRAPVRLAVGQTPTSGQDQSRLSLAGSDHACVRALLLLDVLSKILRLGPEKQLSRLRERLQEIEAEAGVVRGEIANLERLIACRDDTGPRPG